MIQKKAPAMDCGIKSEWVLVTPFLASEWLAANHTNNRKRMKAVVSHYARDMESGHWTTTHQGIAFDSHGRLVDGQHRLAAVVESGCSIWFLVTNGLSEEAIISLDRGKNRTLAHALQWAGYKISNEQIAILKVIKTAPNVNSQRSNDSEMLEGAEDHLANVIEAQRIMAGREYASAIFKGCVARALYSTDVEKLERFGLAINDQLPARESNELDRFARKSMPQLRDLANNSQGTRKSAYCKFQRLLFSHINGEKLGSLRECTDDLFPIPRGVIWASEQPATKIYDEI